MRRLILAAALWPLMNIAAHAACPAVLTDCPNLNANDIHYGGTLTGPGGPGSGGGSGGGSSPAGWLNAADYGLKADGTTSDDMALKAAVDSCAAAGTRLILPPGRILLTGTATISLRNCAVAGVGIMAGESSGTMILLTSTSVKPFEIGDNWSFSGTNFFWPQQTTGTQVYPPLFSPAGAETSGTQGWSIDHCVVVNAYDGIVTGGGRFLISDVFIYAVHDALRVSNIGDSFVIHGVHFTPGPWFSLTGNAAADLMPVVTQNNAMFHVTGTVNMTAVGIASFAWRYGLKIDPGGQVGISEFDWSLDSVGTVIDAGSGGTYASQNIAMRGAASCKKVDFSNPSNTGNAPCFNLGTNANLVLNGWSGDASGDFIRTAGANVLIDRAYVDIGAAKDGGDYYGVHATGSTGGTTISIQNSNISGQQTAHEHGVKTDAAVARFLLRDSSFVYMNDEVNVIPGPTTIISGNWSSYTLSAASINAAALASSGYSVTYLNNLFEKPPAASVTACGTGPQVFGTFSGFIEIGTGTVNSCQLHLPWSPTGVGGGNCVFGTVDGTNGIGGSVHGQPPIWNINSPTNIQGQQIFFNCPGAVQ